MSQRYSRWFTVWPSTHERAGQTVEVQALHPRITHGRHCTCSACAREDWTNPDLAPCGMHGEDCLALYQPLGFAGDTV